MESVILILTLYSMAFEIKFPDSVEFPHRFGGPSSVRAQLECGRMDAMGDAQAHRPK